MLKLINIKKDYVLKGVPTVHALKGLTVNFRRSEFVAILGASGCGKTTLLNIVGGLDRYTSGDLIIEGKSTKKYNDRDWDTYRNHSIGFVFQSYNLIAHQSILKNVELALTISGIKKKERRKRAAEALEVVGLKGMEKKRPNQLSGGQMQRVAIARALVNNPEILLADEPTGALDSETSVQIMDLLKEVALDRLVIMVTHNPDLANEYANRIITMKDGLITGDNNPYEGEGNPAKKEAKKEEKTASNNTIVAGQKQTIVINGVKEKDESSVVTVDTPFVMQYFNNGMIVVTENGNQPKQEEVVKEKPKPKEVKQSNNLNKLSKYRKDKGNKEKTSMSFFTATGLSMSNLLSKSKRTALVAVAGSIGIIGVSMVLSVSTGVHNYIDNMQNDMISQYPISVAEQSVDYASLISGLSSDDKREIAKFPLDTSVGLDSLINYLMDKYEDITDVKTNDINEDLLEYIDMASEYTNSINKNYGLDTTNNIFVEWDRNSNGNKEVISLNGLTQMYIAELQTVDGFSEYATFVDLFTNFMNEIPAEKDYILEQYDILAGTYPESANDIVLVVDENQTLTDLVYAQMGFFSEQEFINIARKAVEENSENPDPEKIKKYDDYPKSYKFTDILGKKLYYYPHDSFWKEDAFTFNAISFNTTMPIQDKNYDLEFVFQYDEVIDALRATISTSGYALNGTFERSEGEKDASNPFKGEWTGKIFGTQLSFTINDTQVILHIDSPSTYQSEAEGNVKFSIDASGMKADINTNYDEASDSLIGTVKTTYNDIPIELPVAFTRYSGEKDESNPCLGNWSGTIMGVYPLAFTVNAGHELIFHFDSPNDYTTRVVTLDGYMYDANPQNDWVGREDVRISAVLKKKKNVNFGCLNRGVYYTRGLTQKMMKDAKNSNIVSGANSIQKYIGSTFENDKPYQAYVKFTYTSYLKGDGPKAVPNVFGYANALNTSQTASLTSLFSITGTSNLNVDKAYLRSLSGLATKEHIVNDETEYTFESLPQSISIYPKDFKIKKKVTDHLKRWNSDDNIVLDSGKTLVKEDRQELTYTDTVELIVSVINTMINVITVALVAFTSLALVVSCFMIAVITYISTMERVKEIGIIRSLGGRKKDVSRLFVAETLIIGLASGVIGIGMTYLLSLILNLVIGSLFGIYTIAALPFYTALIMIGVSVVLNVLSGLFPAMRASNQDPVVALRTE